jgi:hypothetical protein
VCERVAFVEIERKQRFALPMSIAPRGNGELTFCDAINRRLNGRQSRSSSTGKGAFP